LHGLKINTGTEYHGKRMWLSFMGMKICLNFMGMKKVTAAVWTE